MKKVYISGRITGLDYKEAVASFENAEKQLKEAGYEPVNPMKLSHTHDLSWEEYMKVDIKALLDCDLIFMIDGWENSSGAKIERDLAMKLSIKELHLLNV